MLTMKSFVFSVDAYFFLVEMCKDSACAAFTLLRNCLNWLSVSSFVVVHVEKKGITALF